MGIGGRIRDWVNDQAEEWGERLGIFVGNAIGRGGKETIQEIDPELLKGLQATLKWVSELPGSPSPKEIADELAAGRVPDMPTPGSEPSDVPPAQAAAILAASGLGTWIGSPLGLLPILSEISNAGSMEGYRQAAARLYRPTRLSPADAVRATYRGIEGRDWAGPDLAAQGFSDSRIAALGEIYRPLLTPELVRVLSLRYPDDAEKWRSELLKQGYTEDQVEALERLHNIVPPLPDIVRFADFGSFDPDIIALWREFYDAPGFITEPFKLLGISNEGALDWANKYWFSHWRQPGRFEIGEMHRRGLLGGNPEPDERVDNAEEREAAGEIVRNAYKTQGYSAYWQSRLLDLVAENLTRVDVRRMHALGVLDDEALEVAYHRLGYYGKNNEYMVEFTKRYNAEAERAYTKTEILKAYTRGTIDRDTALEYLQEIGYSEDGADFVLDSEDYETAETDRKLSETKIKSLYLSGLMPKLEATDELAGLGYDAREIEYLYSLWDLEAEPAVKLPTRSELAHFLDLGIIDEDEFVTWMKNIGYPDRHINWYLEEYAADAAADAQAAEDKARDAAEKVAKATRATEYERQKAELDVRIAVDRTYIADQNLAALRTEDDELKAEIKDNIAAARVEIAELQEQKARLKLS